MKKRKLKPGVKIALVSTLAGAVLGASINTIAHTCDTPKTDETPKEEKVVIETNPEVETEVIVEKKISLGEFKVTAYCPCVICCGEWANGITYTGTTATAGRTIAVDPDIIPLGSTVEIDGDTYVAEDIGGAIKGKHIDLFFNTHEEALKWGRQHKELLLIIK